MVVKKSLYRSGFSMVEVLVSTIIMSMMMVSILGYIDYGSRAWSKTQAKIENSNYARMVFDLLQHDLYDAQNIYKKLFPQSLHTCTYNYSDLTDATKFSKVSETSGTAMSSLVYDRKIKNEKIPGHASMAAFEVFIDDFNSLVRKTSDDFIENGTLKSPGTLGSTDFSSQRFNIRIARNVKSFEAKMNVDFTIDVTIEFGEDIDGDYILDNSTGKYSTTLLIPQWKMP